VEEGQWVLPDEEGRCGELRGDDLDLNVVKKCEKRM